MNPKKIVLSVTAVIYLLDVTTQANAGIATDAQNFFQSHGTYANGTERGDWKDPSSGVTYHSGGSLEVRFKSSNVAFTPWVDARGPSIKAGCSGFSFDAGFASIIDLQGISDQLSAAGTSMIGGFMSAILYATPILGNIIKTVKHIADQIEAILANACNLGKQMGSATNDFISSHLMSSDPEKEVEGAKDTGFMATSKKWITDSAAKVDHAMTCLGKPTGTASCLSGGAGASTDADAIKKVRDQAISEKFLKNVTTSDLKSNVLAHTNSESSKRGKVYVDKISLKDYLAGGSKTAEHKSFHLTKVFDSSSDLNGYVDLAFLLEKPQYSSSNICSIAETIFKGTDESATDEEKNEMQQLIKNAIEPGKNEKTILTGSAGGNVPISLGNSENDVNGKSFSLENDFTSFLLNGVVKDGNSSKNVYVKKSYIYVANVVKKASDSNSTITQKLTFLCPNKKDSKRFKLNDWVGISGLDNVLPIINKIANKESLTNADKKLPLVAEAAKLAHVLGKKYAIQKLGHGILAPAITAHNIAILNKYFFINALYRSLIDISNLSDSTTGSDANTIINSNKISKSLETLKQMREDLKEQMKNLYGGSFMTAVLRDKNEIDKEYGQIKKRRTMK